MVRTTLLAGLSLLALTNAAAAQSAGDEAAPSSNPTSQSAPSQSQEIVVTGVRESLERAAAIKQNADQIVDSIVSQDIGKFPDPTTAAALQRVPGVQVSTLQTNEIGNVKIRGLGDILTTLDGREIFSTTSRGFSLRDIPAGALSRVDVIKTNTANLIEGGIAGIIDLQLNKPFDFHKPTIVLNARGNYSRYSKRVDPELGLLATDTWSTGIGDIGALIDVTWSQSHYDHPRTREGERRSLTSDPFDMAGVLAPNVGANNVEYGKYQRRQANGSIQWQASNNLQIYLDGLYTGYRARDQRSLITANFFTSGGAIEDVQTTDQCITARVRQDGRNPIVLVDDQGTADPSDDTRSLQPYTVQDLCKLQSATFRNAITEQKTYAFKDDSDDYLGALGFKYDGDSASLHGEVSYQKSTATNETTVLAVGQRVPEWDYVANTGNGSSSVTPGTDFASPDNLVLSQGFNQNFQHSTGDLFTAKLDSTYEIGGILDKFQAGIRYADRSAIYQQAVVNTPAPGGVLGTPTEDSTVPVGSLDLPSDFLALMPGVPLLNDGARGLVPNGDFLRSDSGRDMLRSIFGLEPGDPAYQPQRRFDAAEKTVAGYAQIGYKVPLGSMTLDGLVGVRPTRTERTISGSSQVRVPASGNTPAHTEIRPITARTVDTDILPNASARLRFGGGLQARVTYSKAIRRPDFGSLNPGLSYAISTNPNLIGSGSAGNPDLRPQKSENFDASLAYYFNHGFLAVAVYKRNITDRVISSASPETIDGVIYNIGRPRNVGKADLKGIEVSGQTFFDFLPGALSGFGVFGNFTYADTEVKGDDPLAGYPLQGVSKYNFNAGLLYEKYGLSVRAVYTYRSRYYDGDLTGNVSLREVDPDRVDEVYTPTLLNYVRPSGRLDAGITYDVSKQLRLDFGATNILGSNYYGYWNERYLGNQYRYDDTTYTLGVRFRL